jgi:hypothetical protein
VHAYIQTGTQRSNTCHRTLTLMCPGLKNTSQQCIVSPKSLACVRLHCWVAGQTVPQRVDMFIG